MKILRDSYARVAPVMGKVADRFYSHRFERHPVLRKLGEGHLRIGVMPAYYGMVGACLLDTLAERLETGWTPAVERAWRGCATLVAH